MVNIVISDLVGSKGMIVKTRATARIVEGRLAADAQPGEFHVFPNGTWVISDADTAAHKLLYGGVLIYRNRKNDDGGNPDVDDDYDIDNEPYTDKVGFCIDGVCACFIDDQNATLYPLQPLMISSTAGRLTILALEATGATSGTALRAIIVAVLTRKIVDGDLVAWVGLGTHMWRFM